MGYFIVTLTGAVLLSLPVATGDGRGQPFLDAMFVATSGISTSGLSPVDIGSYYTMFGQIVLLSVFQIGGIGYMTLIILIVQTFGLSTSINMQLVAKESLAGSELKVLGRFFLMTTVLTLFFELIGTLILFLSWMREMPVGRALYYGIFHSISAFCTAGFALTTDSLMGYASDPLINMTINLISIAGGLGFYVLFDLMLKVRESLCKGKRRRLSLHTKMVLMITAGLFLASTAVLLIATQWESSQTIADRVWVASFQAISASTTDGFNTVDISRMGTASLVVLMILMFVGASPGSTGGGIKTTTLGAILLFLWHQVKGRENTVSLMGREIPSASLLKAFGVVSWFTMIIIIDLVIMCVTERAEFLQILFEIVSAMGNTGLSMGITSSLSSAGKIVLIITMFIGRVGPLTVGYFMAGEQKHVPYAYPREDIFIG